PRPQMVRSAWTNLNGNWNYAITKQSEPQPTSWSGKILVPFCIESKLSGVQRLLNANETLWYERSFEANSNDGRRTLLHFEAVDYECFVYVNGQEVGSHIGGNTPFTIDATNAVKPGSNQLVVKVHDTTAGSQLRGKQTLHPQGIWYTRVSGIWQTVWLEQVPSVYLMDVSITTDAAAGTISIKPKRNKDNVGGKLEVVVKEGSQVVAETDVAMTVAAAAGLTVKLDSPKLWSPTSPHLYDLELRWKDDGGQLLDQVTSYAGIRSVGKVQDADGHWRFTLNGEILFHWGPLDQGWWPDGLLTPPSDEAMRFDIQYLQDAGFNMIRKHIKVEPRRYYYHCDKMGMLVWQDQVSGGRGPKWTRLDPNPSDAKWSDADHRQYLAEFDEMVDSLENHPSIVVWVPFNEAWGQHRTVESGEWIAQRDPTRLINIASGGNFWPVGDVVDEHRYPHPGFPFDPQRYADYVKVIGEFGGHGWAVKGHLWDANRENWGYGGLPQSAEEYQQRYLESIRLLKELKGQGIAAGVYTQTTDVEGEINGLMTYDRKVLKLPAAELKQIHQGLVP
ncbi:MAG: glycoside hydrolase family 2, partial [Planctomycetales bacterium]|nr:glycoside hydrolase family 2 [Planctomycetales bacterium]